MNRTKILMITLTGLLGLALTPLAFSEVGVPQEGLFPDRTEVTVKPTEQGAHITVDVAEESDMDISILGEGGRLIRTLHQGPLRPGNYTFIWDGKDGNGGKVSSEGPYAVNAQSVKGVLHREGFFTLTEKKSAVSKSKIPKAPARVRR